ncbi:MAG: hypothetical protein NXH87_09175 [Rhodobiaceae bacterium]|nr:hypothetical protein [Rhodobiaceae bacterium]
MRLIGVIATYLVALVSVVQLFVYGVAGISIRLQVGLTDYFFSIGWALLAAWSFSKLKPETLGLSRVLFVLSAAIFLLAVGALIVSHSRWAIMTIFSDDGYIVPNNILGMITPVQIWLPALYVCLLWLIGSVQNSGSGRETSNRSIAIKLLVLSCVSPTVLVTYLAFFATRKSAAYEMVGTNIFAIPVMNWVLFSIVTYTLLLTAFSGIAFVIYRRTWKPKKFLAYRTNIWSFVPFTMGLIVLYPWLLGMEGNVFGFLYRDRTIAAAVAELALMFWGIYALSDHYLTATRRRKPAPSFPAQND